MLKELIIKNRSYRSFSPDRKITKEEISELIDIARMSPSARNLQPLKYRICVSEKECAKMLSLTSWAGLLRPLVLPPEGHAPAAYIIICTDNELSPEGTNKFLGVDIGIAAQTIMLAATERGLGGCMLGAFSAEKVSAALGIDKKYIPMLVLALGEPDETAVLQNCENGDIKYYRTEDGTHIVPKRKLEDIII